MENNNLFEVIQKGFRTIVGATVEAMETLQDTEKRRKILSQLKSQLQAKSQQWQEKGAITEEEARKLVEQIFFGSSGKKTTESGNGSYSNKGEKNEQELYQSLQSLIEEIVSLRQELEKMKGN